VLTYIGLASTFDPASAWRLARHLATHLADASGAFLIPACDMRSGQRFRFLRVLRAAIGPRARAAFSRLSGPAKPEVRQNTVRLHAVGMHHIDDSGHAVVQLAVARLERCFLLLGHVSVYVRKFRAQLRGLAHDGGSLAFEIAVQQVARFRPRARPPCHLAHSSSLPRYPSSSLRSGAPWHDEKPRHPCPVRQETCEFPRRIRALVLRAPSRMTPTWTSWPAASHRLPPCAAWLPDQDL